MKSFIASSSCIESRHSAAIYARLSNNAMHAVIRGHARSAWRCRQSHPAPPCRRYSMRATCYVHLNISSNSITPTGTPRTQNVLIETRRGSARDGARGKTDQLKKAPTWILEMRAEFLVLLCAARSILLFVASPHASSSTRCGP